MGVLSVIKSLLNIGQPGDPVKDAVIYLETEKGNVPLAFQITGKAGGVTFSHLDKGTYRLVVSLPQQKDKYRKDMHEVQDELQVAFHSGKKIYFITAPQGLFTIRFSDLKNLLESSITPMYEFSEDQKQRMVIGKFEVDSSFGTVVMQISAVKTKTFQRLIQKYKHHAEMSVIRA